MDINEKAIREGMAKANAMIAERGILSLIKFGEKLLSDARISAEYRNLTGNTLTSLAFGVYKNFKLTEIVFIDGVKPAIRRKFTSGDVKEGFKSYDGDIRDVGIFGIDEDGNKTPISTITEVQTDMGWGIGTSSQFLRSFKPTYPNSIVVCTGTEYSEFLENEADLNVLSDTAMFAKSNGLSMFRNGFKKFKK